MDNIQEQTNKLKRGMKRCLWFEIAFVTIASSMLCWNIWRYSVSVLQNDFRGQIIALCLMLLWMPNVGMFSRSIKSSLSSLKKANDLTDFAHINQMRNM